MILKSQYLKSEINLKKLSKKKIYELSNYKLNDYVINLKSNSKSLYKFIYSLSKKKLKILKIYLNKYLKNEFIRFFIFLIEISILFVKKKNDNLRLCVNYKNLNFLTMKNKYFLSLIDESFDRLNKTRIYTNFDMITIYNKFRIIQQLISPYCLHWHDKTSHF